MQVHCDDVVAAGRLQHVGHQPGSNGRAGLVFFVLPGIGEVWDDGGDAACGGGFARIDHYEEFHEAIVYVARGGGLEYED